MNLLSLSEECIEAPHAQDYSRRCAKLEGLHLLCSDLVHEAPEKALNYQNTSKLRPRFLLRASDGTVALKFLFTMP